ncbi:MAG: hypothetical protein JW891_13705 [Candidatus Lokiarchaeota archaeon]|nr:hypothetical protein [Candidatus Lokiarchaeota archaeon]
MYHTSYTSSTEYYYIESSVIYMDSNGTDYYNIVAWADNYDSFTIATPSYQQLSIEYIET